MTKDAENVLEVRGLKTYIRAGSGIAKAVDGISFNVPKGSTFALVGESGCGKSMTALSIIQLVPEPAAYIAGGEVLLSGVDLTKLGDREKREVRGGSVSMIFQEPMTSLNPVLTIGEQVAEAIRLHGKKDKNEAKRLAIEMLAKVGLSDANNLYDKYPHTLSGGMRQRVMIAMALSCNPKLLIADEPTTALDVTIQDQIIRLLKELKESTGTSILLITHNLALVYKNADAVAVMYAGKIVENATAKELFKNPLHPYTIKLMRSIPGSLGRGAPLETIPGSIPPATEYPSGCRFSGRCHREMEGCALIEPQLVERGAGHNVACHLFDMDFMSKPHSRPIRGEDKPKAMASSPYESAKPLIEVSGLATHFPIRKGLFKRVVDNVKAVDGIDLVIKEGSTLALVGESGCGKTTAGKSILKLTKPTSGRISYAGTELTLLDERSMKPYRALMQIIFQDPYSSLNPRMTVMDIIDEGLISLKPSLGSEERRKKVFETLELVGLGSGASSRYPHEFSGGQRQRIGIARALAVEPKFIVCDEAVSALDVSVQAQILNLLKSIQSEFGISYLFITHDLGVVEYIADEVAVMYMGRIVERGDTVKVFERPEHEYTKKLLASVPRMD